MVITPAEPLDKGLQPCRQFSSRFPTEVEIRRARYPPPSRIRPICHASASSSSGIPSKGGLQLLDESGSLTARLLPRLYTLWRARSRGGGLCPVPCRIGLGRLVEHADDAFDDIVYAGSTRHVPVVTRPIGLPSMIALANLKYAMSGLPQGPYTVKPRPCRR